MCTFPQHEGSVGDSGAALHQQVIWHLTVNTESVDVQVQWLAGELWPAIRRQLADDAVELHLYGAYPTHAVQRLHDPVRSSDASACHHMSLHAGVYQLPCALPCYVAYPAGKPTIRLVTPSTCAQAKRLFVKGHMASLDTLRQYRVALAPLHFGAGLKGKVVDSWAHGLPVCIFHSNLRYMTTWHRLYQHNEHWTV